MTTTWQVFATTGVDEICGRAELVNQYKSLFVSGFKDVSDADKEFITKHSEKALTHNLRKSLKTPPPQAEKAHPIWLQEETYARTRPLRMQSPSIHMLIISCFFNEMENACGIESSDENSFTYQI